MAARLKFRFSNGVSITIQVTFDHNFTLCNSECTRTVLVINSGLIHQFCPADLPHGQGRTCVAKLWSRTKPGDENYHN